MIRIKSTLSKKDKKEVKSILEELSDIFGDFYLTRNNIRLYIKENITSLFKLLTKGDKIFFDDGGVAVILGYSEKTIRKYLKILARDEKIADKLVKIINWNISDDLYVKIKKNNPLKNTLIKNNFKFLGNRGKEILLVKKGEKHVRDNARQIKD